VLYLHSNILNFVKKLEVTLDFFPVYPLNFANNAQMNAAR